VWGVIHRLCSQRKKEKKNREWQTGELEGFDEESEKRTPTH
jgi:hypothetical protein